MGACVRAGCSRLALAAWWQLCQDCTRPLLTAIDPDALCGDQRDAAGWDALTWAERISPECWGNAREDDPWVVSVRCLALASVVTGRSSGCPHTVSPVMAVPVVAVAQALGVLRCPPCAEPVVAATSGDGLTCDRCGRAVVGLADRVAAVAGSSLIVVGQLCAECRQCALALPDVAQLGE